MQIILCVLLRMGFRWHMHLGLPTSEYMVYHQPKLFLLCILTLTSRYSNYPAVKICNKYECDSEIQCLLGPQAAKIKAHICVGSSLTKFDDAHRLPNVTIQSVFLSGTTGAPLTLVHVPERRLQGLFRTCCCNNIDTGDLTVRPCQVFNLLLLP